MSLATSPITLPRFTPLSDAPIAIVPHSGPILNHPAHRGCPCRAFAEPGA